MMDFASLMATLADYYDTAAAEFDHKELQHFLSGQASRLRVLTDGQIAGYVTATRLLVEVIFKSRRKGRSRRLGQIVDLHERD